MDSEGIPAVTSLPPPHDSAVEEIFAAAAATAESSAGNEDFLVESPPSGKGAVTAVGSGGNEDHVVESSPSDYDEDLHLLQPASSIGEIRERIIKQVEYYFSDENLPNDKFLLKHMNKDKEGFVSISLVASFRKIKKLTKDTSLVVDALRESSLLVVSPDGKKVKRLHPLPAHEIKDPKLYTVVVENLPEDRSKENIQRIFSEVGNIKSICIHDPYAAGDSLRSNKSEKLVSGKVHALVEYETTEAAEKAVATLNDETDWRNGLRVQLLGKRMGYSMGRKTWKGSDSEKGNHCRISDAPREENTDSSEPLDSAHADEDGENLLREKNSWRSRNRQSRGQKNRGANGMGHGTTAISIISEPSKPPPGPRMPDGTRGFTMGRGKLSVPIQA